MDSFTIQIPPDKIDAVKAEAKAHGVDLTQAYGTLPETHGVVLDYQVMYVNGFANVLFSIKQKPFLVSAGMIEGQVKKLIGI